MDIVLKGMIAVVFIIMLNGCSTVKNIETIKNRQENDVYPTIESVKTIVKNDVMSEINGVKAKMDDEIIPDIQSLQKSLQDSVAPKLKSISNQLATEISPNVEAISSQIDNVIIPEVELLRTRVARIEKKAMQIHEQVQDNATYIQFLYEQNIKERIDEAVQAIIKQIDKVLKTQKDDKKDLDDKFEILFTDIDTIAMEVKSKSQPVQKTIYTFIEDKSKYIFNYAVEKTQNEYNDYNIKIEQKTSGENNSPTGLIMYKGKAQNSEET